MVKSVYGHKLSGDKLSKLKEFAIQSGFTALVTMKKSDLLIEG